MAIASKKEQGQIRTQVEMPVYGQPIRTMGSMGGAPGTAAATTSGGLTVDPAITSGTRGTTSKINTGINIKDKAAPQLIEFNPGTAPTFDKFGATGSQGTPMFSNVFNAATGGTIDSFNTAANRLRERLTAQSRGLQDQATSQGLARGTGASGGLNRSLERIGLGVAGEEAQGLSNLASEFEGRRQQGLQTALGAAQGTEQAGQFLNSLNQMDEQQRRELITSLFQSGEANKLSNVNTIDQAMADMFGSVMGATGAGRTELMNLFRSMIEGGLNLDELITNIGGGAPGAN